MENKHRQWRESLSRTRKSTFGKIATFFGASEINQESWEELEALLIGSDLGGELSLDIISDLQSRANSQGLIRQEDLLDALAELLQERLPITGSLELAERPTVVLITGVNGSGKTTTIAKLGHLYQQQGLQVAYIAGDTFRAAAVEQLQEWGQRQDIPVTAGQPKADPGSVVFDGLQSALSSQADLVLIDTAGRLHTSYNLMEELKKVYRVAGKALPGAPHASWLVLDATTGQNAFHQAAAFQEAIPLDGVILAKLDSSAKGGMVFSIQARLGLPVIFAGLGERPEDLVPFEPDLFIKGILEGFSGSDVTQT